MAYLDAETLLVWLAIFDVQCEPRKKANRCRERHDLRHHCEPTISKKIYFDVQAAAECVRHPTVPVRAR